MTRPDPLQEIKLTKRLDAAALALADGRLDEAAADYAALVAEHPDRPGVWRGMGVLQARLGRLEEAEQALRRAEALAAQDPGILNDLGEVLRLAGKTAEAEAAFDAALRLQPEHPQALNNLGVVLMQVDVERARDCFLRAIRAQPGYAHPYNNLGVLQERQGHIDEALRCYEAAVVVQPDFQAALENYHDLLQRFPDHLADSVQRLVRLAEGWVEDEKGAAAQTKKNFAQTS